MYTPLKIQPPVWNGGKLHRNTFRRNYCELQSYFGSIRAKLCEHEDDIICHSGCDVWRMAARYYLEESGQLGELPALTPKNYIDYAAYGRDMEWMEPLLSRTRRI